MNLGQTHVSIGIITVFVAIFMLFYIFDNIDKITKNCQADETIKVCQECCKLGRFGMSILVIVLIVGGLTLVACSTAYILLTS